MATASQAWQIEGQYFETCNCDFLCPCITTNLAGAPSKGACTFAMVLRIDRGRFGQTSLDGISFSLVGHSPGAMIDGNWSVALIVDERASSEQEQALAAIVGGQAGGPMAAAAPLVADFKGIQRAPIELRQSGLSWSASIPGILDQAAEGVPGGVQGEPIYLDNTVHPANSRLGLAKATRSHVDVFGLKFDDTSGSNNAHFAPFRWSGS